VQAFDGEGTSDYSNEACASPAVVVTTVLDLTVTKAGTGTGTVTSSPSGIDCGTACSGSYAGITTVTLTATPSSGGTFTGWAGSCTGTASCTVTDSPAAVTANFAAAPLALTVAKAGTGTGTVTSNPAGINCGADCSESYPGGTTVTLTATPLSGSTFTGWSGSCTGTASCTVTNSPATVTANFAAAPTAPIRKLTVYVYGQGEVTSSPGDIDCPGTCSEGFASGTVVTLTAAPVAGSRFLGWNGSGCRGTGTCKIDLKKNKGVSAYFLKR
jgi:hypothetical protein